MQSGAYLGEDDIVRFEDSYGRVEKGRTAGVAAGSDPAPATNAVPKPTAGGGAAAKGGA
ncbi:hypothetical protein D3C83_243680 [compost metagenome]